MQRPQKVLLTSLVSHEFLLSPTVLFLSCHLLSLSACICFKSSFKCLQRDVWTGSSLLPAGSSVDHGPVVGSHTGGSSGKSSLLPDRTERVSPCCAGLSTSHLSCECPRAPLGVRQPSSGMALHAGCSISPVGSLPPPSSPHQRRFQTHTAPHGLVSLPSEWAYQFTLVLRL